MAETTSSTSKRGISVSLRSPHVAEIASRIDYRITAYTEGDR